MKKFVSKIMFGLVLCTLVTMVVFPIVSADTVTLEPGDQRTITFSNLGVGDTVTYSIEVLSGDYIDVIVENPSGIIRKTHERIVQYTGSYTLTSDGGCVVRIRNSGARDAFVRYDVDASVGAFKTFGIILLIVVIFIFLGIGLYYVNKKFLRKKYTYSTSTQGDVTEIANRITQYFTQRGYTYSPKNSAPNTLLVFERGHSVGVTPKTIKTALTVNLTKGEGDKWGILCNYDVPRPIGAETEVVNYLNAEFEGFKHFVSQVEEKTP